MFLWTQQEELEICQALVFILQTFNQLTAEPESPTSQQRRQTFDQASLQWNTSIW